MLLESIIVSGNNVLIFSYITKYLQIFVICECMTMHGQYNKAIVVLLFPN